MKPELKVVAVALVTGVALGSLTALSSCQRQQESALKPISEFIERKPLMMHPCLSLSSVPYHPRFGYDLAAQ
jgi:hypothetical protein